MVLEFVCLMLCVQAGEYFIENVLKGKGTEKRTKNLVADKVLEAQGEVNTST